MEHDRDREDILEDIDIMNVALDTYHILTTESDEFIDEELEEDLMSAIAELEQELAKFDKRYLN